MKFFICQIKRSLLTTSYCDSCEFTKHCTVKYNAKKNKPIIYDLSDRDKYEPELMKLEIKHQKNTNFRNQRDGLFDLIGSSSYRSRAE